MAKKYKIYQAETADDYILEYKKDKEIVKLPFRRSIKVRKRFEEVNSNARINMYLFLTKNNLTKKDFVVETKNEDGSTSYDESNWNSLEERFTNEERIKLINDLIKELLGISLVELITELELFTEKEVTAFTVQFLTTLLQGSEEKKIPS